MVPSQTVTRTCSVLLLAFPIFAGAADALPPIVVSTLERFNLPTDTLSVHVRDLDTDEVVLDVRSDQPRNPASTMKVVTGLAALDRLGPSYRWSTRVFATAEPVDGRIDGDLIVVGGGDPYLVEERLYRLIRRLRVDRIDSVSGDLIVDDTLFETPSEDRSAFDNQPFRVYNALPSAALANFNTIRFLFEPESGSSVAVRPDPALDNLRYINRLRSIDARCRGFRRGIATAEHPDAHIAFDGRFPNRCMQYSLTRAVMPAWLYTGDLFAWLFRNAGGELDGRIVRGELPDDAVLVAEFDSLSLAEIVRLMNKHSSNLIARQLLLTLAVEAGGPPASEAQGVAELQRWLADAGFDFEEFAVENGAGRSRDARITARHLVDIIEYGYRSPVMPEFLGSMARYGEDGTLQDRQDFPSLAGRAHLKTGSLDHVTALAGVFHAENGRRFALAILQNADDAHRGGGQAVQDRLLEWLGSQNRAAAGR
ncbi:MAG: D-alanyl-D-alanine carboxypeptidase/D-alanyl-D-alanine-endopeptidase [Pseudomonadota bacterium]